MDHYTTLGVNKNASDDEIKRAYRSLAKQYHPDSGGDDAKFKQINEAYDTLKDPHKRGIYDHSQTADQGVFRFNSRSFESGMFDDILRAASGFHHSQYTQPKNKDLRVTLDINLSSILESQQKTIHLKTGRSEKTVQVDIPAGVNDGATIRYRGYGQDVRTQVPPGDLIVTIRVHNERGFTREHKNLYSEITIDAVDAMLGSSVEFKNLDGNKVLLKIPAGAQPGQQLRLSGKGLANENGTVGDLILSIKVSIPKTLTDKQKNILQQFKNS